MLSFKRKIILVGFISNLSIFSTAGLADNYQPIHPTKSPPILAELMKSARRINPPDLAKLIDETSRNNPEIRAADDRWIAEKYSIPQASALPDPLFSVGNTKLDNTQNAEANVLEGLVNYGAIQDFPYLGKLYERSKIANISANRAKEEYRAVTMAVISELKSKYYKLHFIDTYINIIATNLETLRNIKILAVNTSKKRGVPQPDFYRLDTQISRYLLDLVRLKQKHGSLEAEINRLANRSLEEKVNPPKNIPVEPFNYSIERLYELIRECSPKLNVYKKSVEKSKENIRLSEMDYFPDVEVQAEGLRDQKLKLDGFQIFVKASVPVYFMKKQDKAVRESISRYHAEIEDYQKGYLDLAFKVKNAYLVVKRSDELIKMLNTYILPQAEKTYNASKGSYESGEIDLLTILHNLLTLQEDQLDLAIEKYDHEVEITEIEQVIGIFL